MVHNDMDETGMFVCVIDRRRRDLITAIVATMWDCDRPLYRCNGTAVIRRRRMWSGLEAGQKATG